MGAVMLVKTDHTALLADLAKQINEEHAAVIASFRQVMNERAFKIGGLLLEAKKLTEHGKWLKWVKANCQFTSRTATFYMTIAGLDEANRKTVSDLPLREIMRAVYQRKYLSLEEHLEQSRNPPPQPEQTEASPKVRAEGLNAVGKPYSASYDPNYQLRHRVSKSHLRSNGTAAFRSTYQEMEYFAAQMAKHFCVEQIERIYKLAVDMRKALKPEERASI
jgi:hypothetical protein